MHRERVAIGHRFTAMHVYEKKMEVFGLTAAVNVNFQSVAVAFR